MKIVCRAIPEDVYMALMDQAVVKLCEKHPMVNATFQRRDSDELEITFKAFKQLPQSWVSLTWDEILCQVVTPSIKASPCRVGRSQKVFFRRAESLREYIVKLKSKKISQKAHCELFSVVLDTFKQDFVNHNFDVRLLHFKG